MPKKKVKKFRGSRTHGKGRNRRNRGAGCRGGRGNAGVHKHKYLRFIKLAKMGLYQFGKYGFTRPKVVRQDYKSESYHKKVLRRLKEEMEEKLKGDKEKMKLWEYTYKFLYSRTVINVDDIEEIIDKLVELGLAGKEDGKYVLDLTALGYTKLLGRGIITKPVEVKVQSATDVAIQKIEEAGGKVILEA